MQTVSRGLNQYLTILNLYGEMRIIVTIVVYLDIIFRRAFI